jgi:hypothetical protein
VAVAPDGDAVAGQPAAALEADLDPVQLGDGDRLLVVAPAQRRAQRILFVSSAGFRGSVGARRSPLAALLERWAF